MQASLIKMKDIHGLMQELGQRARIAYAQLAEARNAQKDMALVQAAQALREHQTELLQANQQDIQDAKGLTDAFADRLRLTPERIEAMAAGLETVATLPDPVNKIIDEWQRPNGLTIQRVSIPLGVIGIIYESRPNVTADAAALCIKAGNSCILRGGSESLQSSQLIVACIREGLAKAELPEDAVQIVPTPDRAAVGEMLGMIGLIDVIIPRGGKSLTERVLHDSRVPTLLHLDGNCHTYIHAGADLAMAQEIVINAKLRRTGICGATESLVVDEAITTAVLPPLVDDLSAKGCKLVGDMRAQQADKRIQPASESDWGREYLDAMLSVKVVAGLEEAIAHINHYGSGHTDAIITKDQNAARMFMRRVDSAIVMHNASTQFADGGEFGFGAEIGIATGRLHARGPVGAEQLTTYKYVVHGNGQIRD